MDIYQLIKARKSVRAFLNKEVPQRLIKKILDAAKYAPSGTNTQPWEVAVVQGKAKIELARKLSTAFDEGQTANMEYHYYPERWVEPFKSRRLACGLQLYGALEIEREDKEKQKAHWRRNYQAFDAPVILLFFLDRVLEKGSFMDYGMFLQNLMLCAIEEGLSTCAQAALGQYPDIVREQLDIPNEKLLLCGMAIGYEDKEHVLNKSYRTPRENVDHFVSFYS